MLCFRERNRQQRDTKLPEPLLYSGDHKCLELQNCVKGPDYTNTLDIS